MFSIEINLISCQRVHERFHERTFNQFKSNTNSMATAVQSVQDVPQPRIKALKLDTYTQAAESTHDRKCNKTNEREKRLIILIVPWADLITLDLSKFDEPGGKQKLASQLKDAVHNVGFFYVRSPPST